MDSRSPPAGTSFAGMTDPGAGGLPRRLRLLAISAIEAEPGRGGALTFPLLPPGLSFVPADDADTANIHEREPAQVVGQPKPGILELPVAGPAEQLQVHLVEHPEAGGTDRMAEALQAAVDLARYATVCVIEAVHDVLDRPAVAQAQVALHPELLARHGHHQRPAQQELPLVYAWMIGDNVHKDAGNLQNLPNDPDTYYANLDFSDLERTVRAANRFYDNPGVDTDVDGYRGEFTVCCVESVLVAPSVYQCTLEDTVWIAGDGIPDYAPYTPSCCEGRTGNVNMTDIVDLSDLAGLISYLVGGGYVLPCWDEANVNGTDIVDLSDLAGLISYLVGGGYVLPACP